MYIYRPSRKEGDQPRDCRNSVCQYSLMNECGCQCLGTKHGELVKGFSFVKEELPVDYKRRMIEGDLKLAKA